MDEIKKGDVLLKVENLCQYFGKTFEELFQTAGDSK